MIALWVIAAAACSEEPTDNPALTGDIEFSIVPQVADAIETRAAVVGETFGSGAQVGLRLEATVVPKINSMYDNFYTTYNGTGWRYFLNGVNVGARLSGFSNWGTVSVMGYYPYNAAATNFDAIPFRVTADDGTATKEEATTDYMVAQTKTKTMANNESEVTLKFEHLMTYVYLYLTRSYQGPQLILHKVALELDNGREFIIAGTFDARNPDMTDIPGLITPMATKNRIEITTNYTITSSTSGTYTIPLVIMPQLVEADGSANVTVTLYFTNAVDGTEFLFDDQGNPQMTFALSDIDGGLGFQRGKQYRLTATLGTYTHFEGAPTVDFRPIEDADTASDEYIEI